MQDSVAQRLDRVRLTVASVAERAGRTDRVTLVAVTKTVDTGRIRQAYEAGQQVFGENKVQEGVAKIQELSNEMPEAAWHLIGHLQRNKARAAVEKFSLIESIDSVRLAERLNAQAADLGCEIPIFLEVNVAGEDSKYGFSPDTLQGAMPVLMRLSHLRLRGLMTIAPQVDDPELVRPVFRQLREVRDRVNDRFAVEVFCELSMGMSGDFETAIQEGATMVRIGRAIFGERSER